MLDTIHVVCFVLVFTEIGFAAVIGGLLLVRVLSRWVLGEYYDPHFSLATMVLPTPLWLLFWRWAHIDGGMWIDAGTPRAALGWRLSNSLLLTQAPQAGLAWLLVAPVPMVLVFLWCSFVSERAVRVTPWHTVYFSATRGHPRWKA